MLTQQELEKLVKLIGSGKNTYADLHKLFPYMSNTDWMQIIGDDFKIEDDDFGVFNTRLIEAANYNKSQIIIFFENVPENYSRSYEFKNDDSFELSVPGANLFYQLDKEKRNKRLIVISTVSGIIAAIASLCALFK